MAQQTINIGTIPGDDMGDSLYVAGGKINDNFDELYASLGVGLGTAAYLDVDPDDTLAADSDSLIPTQQAVKAHVAAQVAAAVTGLLDLRGSTDCSANPNYPAASKGDAYVVSVAGKIGGGSGQNVAAGDVYFAKADNAGGTEGSVGSSWAIIEHNLPTLGTAALVDTGTSSGNVPLLGAGGLLANARLDPRLSNNPTGVVALTDAATIATDATLGHTFEVTLGGNRTLGNPTGAVNRQKFTFCIKQDGTGGRTLAFDTKFRYGVDLTDATVNSGAGKESYIGVIYNSAADKFDIVAVSRGH